MAEIYLFYGNDTPLILEKARACEQKIVEKTPDIQKSSFEEISFDEILSHVENNSLFTLSFLVKIKKIKGKIVPEMWENTPHTLIISSFEEKDPFPKENSPAIQKIACQIPKPWDLIKKIQALFGSKITADASEYLSKVLTSFKEIEEIKKQASFYNIGLLDITDLQNILNSDSLDSFSLVDYFFFPKERNRLFLSSLDTMVFRNQSFDSFFSLLMKKVNDLISIKKDLEMKTATPVISKKLGIHPFILSKLIPTVDSYTNRQLENLAKQVIRTQFLSRFYGSKMDKILITKLFLQQKEIHISSV